MLQKMQGRNEDARELLQNALELCQSSGMNYVRERVENSIKNLENDEPIVQIVERFSNHLKNTTIPAAQTKEIQYTILGCIVMLREGGLEIYSKYTSDELLSDPSMVAGLISAVSTFASGLKEDSRGELQSIVHQDIAVLLEHGRNVSCALLSDKDTYQARIQQRKFIEQFEDTFSDQLLKFDGGISAFKIADEFFSTIFTKTGI